MSTSLARGRLDISALGAFRLQARLPGDPDVSYYQAVDSDAQQKLLKRLVPSQRFDSTRKFLFEQESDLARNLNHPGLATWLERRNLDGETLHIFAWSGDCGLDQVLAAQRYQERLIDPGLAAFMFNQVLDAVEYFLEIAGDMDQDLPPPELSVRPSLIRVSGNGDLVLADFRIGPLPSKYFSRFHTDDMTLNFYAAPEQCVAGRRPDRRALFYSLGVLAFELFTNRPLFTLSQRLELQAVNRRKVRCLHPRASDVDPGLAAVDDLILALLHPLPEKRLCDFARIRSHLLGIPMNADRRSITGLVEEWARLRDQVLSGAINQAGREQHRLTSIE